MKDNEAHFDFGLTSYQAFILDQLVIEAIEDCKDAINESDPEDVEALHELERRLHNFLERHGNS